jgi:hypothetical protein
MFTRTKLIPIYTTSGDVGAYLLYPYIYNQQGEWIGWISPERKVYSVLGQYVGEMNKDPRILRRREVYSDEPRREPPPPPPPIRPPAYSPLPPQMAEVALNTIDVLEEAPHMLPSSDSVDLRPDMD